jgi:hypothetical protein
MTDPLCPFCEEPITSDDRRAPDFRTPTHYECGLRAALGSVGHQRKLCSCYGGTEEDPPGMTRRQAAVAAAMHFHLGRLPTHFPDQQCPKP